MNQISAKKFKIPSQDLHLRYSNSKDYDILITEDTIVRDSETNEIVLALINNAVDKKIADDAFAAMFTLKNSVTNNRSAYSGKERKSLYRSKKTSYAVNVASITAGYFERQGGRHKCCRKCSWNRDNPKDWSYVSKLVHEIASVYEQIAPDKYQNQVDFSKQIHPDWLIGKTPFTTVTINNTVKAALHTDRGDYKEGLGTLYSLHKGVTFGWVIVMPEYRVAIKQTSNSLILFNPHLWHGHLESAGGLGKKNKSYARISLVCYARQKMIDCMSAKEEIERAKYR